MPHPHQTAHRHRLMLRRLRARHRECPNPTWEDQLPYAERSPRRDMRAFRRMLKAMLGRQP